MRGKKAGWGRRWVAATGAVIAALGAITLSAPAPVAALDSDLKGSAVFKLEGSNGYSIIGFAASERADGRGDLVLVVSKGSSGVLYAAPALVTPSRLEANLGVLGQISLAIAPSGVERTLKSHCGGDVVTVEPHVYRGSFEFHGEEGYTGARATTLREYSRFGVDLVCSGMGWGERHGGDLPGARLTLRRGKGHTRLSLQVNKNRPGARARLEVEMHEKRHRIEIARGTALWTDGGAFAYDPLLRTARLAPPAPFAGEAAFHRNATPANRWTGNLTVDLPGRSDVPLAAAGTRAMLIPFCWHEGEGRFRC